MNNERDQDEGADKPVEEAVDAPRSSQDIGESLANAELLHKPGATRQAQDGESTQANAEPLHEPAVANPAKGPSGDQEQGEPAPASASGYSESELASAVTARHASEWKYVPERKCWMVWDGTRWKQDIEGKVAHGIRTFCRQLPEKDLSARDSLRVWSAHTVDAVCKLMSCDPDHVVSVERFDKDPLLLNTPGGVLDLASGTLSPHRRENFLTLQTNATPRGDCPLWREFLYRISDGDEALIAYLQRVVGYCLSGSTAEQVLFFLHGTGANGKSIFVSVLAHILGTYAGVLPAEALMVTHGERHPTEIASLNGARFVQVSETESGSRWAEAKVKVLTGGDRISARFLYRDAFVFTPQFKLMVVGNHRPVLHNVDEAIRRRIHMVPFPVVIPAQERDPDLLAKLMTEADGILAWARDGYEQLREGLNPPPCVRSATGEFLDGEDALGTWLGDCCEFGDGFRETSANLFDSWKRWAETNGEYVVAKNRLIKALRDRGLDSYRTGKERGLKGLRLVEPVVDSEVPL